MTKKKILITKKQLREWVEEAGGHIEGTEDLAEHIYNEMVKQMAWFMKEHPQDTWPTDAKYPYLFHSFFWRSDLRKFGWTVCDTIGVYIFNGEKGDTSGFYVPASKEFSEDGKRVESISIGLSADYVAYPQRRRIKGISVLAHELQHAYRDIMMTVYGNPNAENSKDRYYEVLDNENISDFYRKIIYLIDKDEVGSFVNELYTVLQKKQLKGKEEIIELAKRTPLWNACIENLTKFVDRLSDKKTGLEYAQYIRDHQDDFKGVIPFPHNKQATLDDWRYTTYNFIKNRLDWIVKRFWKVVYQYMQDNGIQSNPSNTKPYDTVNTPKSSRMQDLSNLKNRIWNTIRGKHRGW